MKHIKKTQLFFLILVSCFANLHGIELSEINSQTKHLNAGKVIYENNFNEPVQQDEIWTTRKLPWYSENGILIGRKKSKEDQVTKKAPTTFLRLKGIQAESEGAILPKNYIMSFKFRMGEKEDGTISPKGRFSLGHLKLQFNWREIEGMSVHISNGLAIANPDFKIKEGVWYEVVLETYQDEVICSIKNGPTYFLKHELISEALGWEMLVDKEQDAFLDYVKVWDVSPDFKPEWEKVNSELRDKGHVFISSENPDFSMAKLEKPAKTAKKK